MLHWILRSLGVLICLVSIEAAAQSVPQNATPSPYGAGWQCDRGFFRSGNGCLPVQIPPNAQINALGNGWQCVRGYSRSGDECLVVRVPQNAQLNALGNGWQCNRGFSRSGEGCLQVQIPRNAELNALGSGWQCSRGFSRSGDGCHPVQIPQNAELNALGSGWQCRRGFSRSGEGCQLVVVPQNAELNVLGNGWQCKTGHTREGETCRPMTAEEFKTHRERMARLLEVARQRAARGDCETESQSGAEVCLTITNSYFDCDKSFEGTSYRGCSLSISYEVSTDYRGQSSIDVDVECEASIDTKKRQGFSGFETAQDDESHTLYANGNDSETVRLSFDFSSFQEVYGASVSTASCKIDDVSLN